MEHLPEGTTVLGRYTLGKLMAKTPTSYVYEGTHNWLDNVVAIHVHRESAGDKAMQRFVRSMKMMARIRHPNVVSLLDYGLSHGVTCIVTELPEGTTLREHIDGYGATPWPRALDLMRPVLVALHAAHEAGVVHRDLKPANVVFQRNRPKSSKLVGLGLAKALEGDDLGITDTGAVVGTESYLAPERARAGQATVAGDVYSAGLVLYELLVGELPEGKPPLRIDRVLRRTVTPPEAPVAPKGLPKLPAPLAELVVGMLAIDPAGRPPSAGQVVQSLDRLRNITPTPFAAADLAETPSAAALVQAAASDNPQDSITVPAFSVDAIVAPGERQLRMTPASWQAMMARSSLRDVMRTPPRAAGSEPIRAMLAAWLPAEARGARGGWLDALAGPGAQCFHYRDLYWLVMVRARDASEAEAECLRIEGELHQRLADRVRVAWRPAGDSFALSDASATGQAAPPREVMKLLEAVASGR